MAVPVMHDQPFRAARLTAPGVAPAAIPFRRLTPDRLAAALTTAVTDPGAGAGGPRPCRPGSRRRTAPPPSSRR
ncbi:hypothetical protein [Herbidospora cretacea]|uniref:hypothetical protein n=1 Tax=Herbidospora cretacea TaxID=28444 RepID=UPI0012FBEB3C|nr:hypothetical protein [Herbidospora cretacea]